MQRRAGGVAAAAIPRAAARPGGLVTALKVAVAGQAEESAEISPEAAAGG